MEKTLNILTIDSGELQIWGFSAFLSLWAKVSLYANALKKGDKAILKLVLGHRHTRTNTDFHYFLTKYHLKEYRVIGFEGDLNQEEFMYLWDEN